MFTGSHIKLSWRFKPFFLLVCFIETLDCRGKMFSHSKDSLNKWLWLWLWEASARMSKGRITDHTCCIVLPSFSVERSPRMFWQRLKLQEMHRRWHTPPLLFRLYFFFSFLNLFPCCRRRRLSSQQSVTLPWLLRWSELTNQLRSRGQQRPEVDSEW